MRIKRAGIITKAASSEPERISRELRDWFARKSVATVINQVSEDLDILVILGGDGTLLHIAALASRHDIPVVGINLGGLGFLTEVAVDEMYDTLEAIRRGSVVIEERMMLKARLHSPDRVSEYQYGLNEVVISKSNIDHLVRLRTWANDELAAVYRADGLIFSTPTGSTAYNLSAGGPVVHPAMHSILVTPICPFMLESRPVLLPPTVSLKTMLYGPANDLKIIVDGRLAWSMKENDQLEIRASEKPLRLICSPNKGYFEILRNKLNWGAGGMKIED